ncbi:purine-binding chemotaxis protein CheW [Vibrio vulnificus]|uniref:chemotaxis protein CheW n=1 Tax=Vibrio vulnificus TaxID=672 RepID=UPI0009B6AAFE|nr:chemotaxis protein CheW [Vibrio vulnificus]EHK8997914.1 purine-binding chemotaxis protein CheW [Vibrio vulnificus]EHU4926636.1 purine-binding chemotaxis protein CheW [Vibrio vulnificus]EIX4882916.1 purine-binding chemotaxis protein CheW [Vibrio vulnificus]EIX4886177.1 purine-binding chemotaxis protein CheW [Vibrio vulnificus]EIZ1281497.1 purine-binding chemotaxis protein CheW [Vibrio vulnificus]
MELQEYLSFVVDDDEYGVPILDVREVRGWSDVRKVPNAPAYLVGVLEIRGEYVPVVDLRVRFHLPPSHISNTTVVVVLNDVQHNPLGIIVDAVAEVYALEEGEIKPPPQTMKMEQRYIKGLAATSNGHLIIINLEALFDVAELNRTTVEEALM